MPPAQEARARRIVDCRQGDAGAGGEWGRDRIRFGLIRFGLIRFGSVRGLGF